MLVAEQESYSSRKDKKPLSGDVTFYGQLTDIIQILYLNGMKHVLFRCNWIDTKVGSIRIQINHTFGYYVNIAYMRVKRRRTMHVRDISNVETSTSQTTSQSHIENVDPGTGDTECNSNSKKRGRGSAKPWKGWGDGEKKIIGWNNKCQPIEPNSHKLGSQLGYFSRQGSLFPLTTKCWSEVPEPNLEFIWNNVKENTNAPDGYKLICFEKIGNCWRSFKGRIKRDYYSIFNTDEERLSHVPPHLDSAQWFQLVSFWGEENSKRVAAKNVENRKNQCAYTRTGRTSFANVTETMIKEGVATDKLSIWRRTRKRSNGYNVEDGAAGREETICRRLSDLPIEDQNNVVQRDMIFEDVIGQDGHGRVHCMGVGVRMKLHNLGKRLWRERHAIGVR